MSTNLISTRISLLRRSLQLWAKSIASALETAERMRSRALDYVDEILGPINNTADEVNKHTMVLIELCEQNNIPCPQLHKLAFGPAYLQDSESDARALVAELATIENAAPPSGGKWSRPMSKTEMMVRLKINSPRKFGTFTKAHPLREAGNRQLWQICLDRLDPTSRQNIERP